MTKRTVAEVTDEHYVQAKTPKTEPLVAKVVTEEELTVEQHRENIRRFRLECEEVRQELTTAFVLKYGHLPEPMSVQINNSTIHMLTPNLFELNFEVTGIAQTVAFTYPPFENGFPSSDFPSIKPEHVCGLNIKVDGKETHFKFIESDTLHIEGEEVHGVVELVLEPSGDSLSLIVHRIHTNSLAMKISSISVRPHVFKHAE